MGLHIIGRKSWSLFDGNKAPNPDPRKYVIQDYKYVGKNLVLKIRYPDCNNYEGTKILVFEGCTILALREQGIIDPHFSDTKTRISPVARFEPTDRGWDWAVAFAEKM